MYNMNVCVCVFKHTHLNSYESAGFVINASQKQMHHHTVIDYHHNLPSCILLLVQLIFKI